GERSAHPPPHVRSLDAVVARPRWPHLASHHACARTAYVQSTMQSPGRDGPARAIRVFASPPALARAVHDCHGIQIEDSVELGIQIDAIGDAHEARSRHAYVPKVEGITASAQRVSGVDIVRFGVGKRRAPPGTLTIGRFG